MQLFMFVGPFANLWSVMRPLREDDLLPETQWLVVRNDIDRILGSKAGRYFWENGGKVAFDSGFSAFVESERSVTSRPFDRAKMTEASNEVEG